MMKRTELIKRIKKATKKKLMTKNLKVKQPRKTTKQAKQNDGIIKL